MRLDYVDIAKGIAIILVVCSHTVAHALMDFIVITCRALYMAGFPSDENYVVLGGSSSSRCCCWYGVAQLIGSSKEQFI